MNHDDNPKKRQDQGQKQGGRPATKFIERPKPQHPENRPDVDQEQANPGYGETSIEEPGTQKKMPDPNWQEGKYTQREKQDKEPEGSGE